MKYLSASVKRPRFQALCRLLSHLVLLWDSDLRVLPLRFQKTLLVSFITSDLKVALYSHYYLICRRYLFIWQVLFHFL